MRKHHAICELHFKKEEVLKDFVHLMADGSTYTLAKDKPSLKKGSTPSIFSTVSETQIENKKVESLQCYIFNDAAVKSKFQ